MKKIAIVGFGNHVQKNILPAVSRLPDVDVEAIYLRNPQKYEELGKSWNVLIKHIDHIVLAKVSWIYISTPITTHFDLASICLSAGKNVICEKPLTDNLAKTKELINLAKENAVILKEVCMYQYHKQYKNLESVVLENKSKIKVLKTRFSIPHLERENIRYKKELGGGAILDVGFYPISLIVSLFGKPLKIHSVKLSYSGYQVDLLGSAIFEYDSFYCHAEWGIGLPYSNDAVLLTTNEEYKYERIFSKPETLKTYVEVRKGFEFEKKEIGADDQFVNMFNAIISDGLSDNDQTVNTIEVIESIGR